MADYHVSVHLKLVSAGMAASLSLITSHLMRMHTHVGRIEEGFKKWQPALMGVVGIFTGGLIVKGLWDIASHSDKIIDKMIQMKLQGQDLAEIQKNWAKSLEVSSATGMPTAGIMEEIKKSSYIIGKPEEARELVEQFSKLEAILGFVSGKSAEGQINPLMKILEAGILGVPGREKDLQRVLDLVSKDIEATGGTVTPQMLQQNFAYSRAARFGWLTPEALEEKNPFLFTTFPWMLQAFGTGRGGASGLGNQMMSAFTKGVQGILSKESIKEAGFLGVIGERQGKFKPGFINPELFTRNPYEWAQQELWPKMKAQGITSVPDIIKHLVRLFGTRAAADPFIDMILMGRGKLGMMSPAERHMRAIHQAPGMEGFKDIQESPTFQAHRVAAMWEKLMQVIGMPGNSMKVAFLTKLADALDSLGKAAEKIDPNVIKGIGGALGGLGVGLMTLGSAAVLGALVRMAGPMGLLASVGLAFLSMSDKVHKALADLGEAMSTGDMAKIKEAGAKLAAACVDAIVDGIAAVMQSAAARVKQAVSDGLSKTMEDIYGIKRPAIGLGPQGSETIIPKQMAPWHWDRPYFRHHRPGETVGEAAQSSGPSVLERGGSLLDDFFSRLYNVPNRGGAPGAPGGPQPVPALPWDFRGGVPMPGLSPAMPSLPTPSIPPSGLLQKQSWEPGGGVPGAQQINNVIYLDGSAIARAVHDYSAADMTHPRQAAYFDGRANYTPPDMQTITV